MPGRIAPLEINEYYHVFNRGVEKRTIFILPREYKRFIRTFYYYQFLGIKPKFSNFTKSKLNLFNPIQGNKLVEIVSYCLMPNHFHFLVRQLKTNGISVFVSQFCNSYTKYFNAKYKRIGPLFQGRFKAVRIENDEQLVHVSRYIHINPIVSHVTKNLATYPWSSYSEYVLREENYCSTKEILGFFPSRDSYKEFLEDQVDYGKTLELLKHVDV